MLTALAELWCVQHNMAICDSFGPLLPHGWRMTLFIVLALHSLLIHYVFDSFRDL